MTIGTVVLMTAAFLFFAGFVIAMMFDNKLTENDCVESMSERAFSKFCIGVDTGIILMIISVIILIIGVVLTVTRI